MADVNPFSEHVGSDQKPSRASLGACPTRKVFVRIAQATNAGRMKGRSLPAWEIGRQDCSFEKQNGDEKDMAPRLGSFEGQHTSMAKA